MSSHIVTDATGLFQLIEDEDWADAILQTKAFPKEAKTWVVKKMGKLKFRRLPLHEACIRNAPNQLIECLVYANPDALRASDESGRLPLHHAVFHGTSKKALNRLVMGFPESLDAVDKGGQTPIELAMLGRSTEKAVLVSFLSTGSLYYTVQKEEERWARHNNEIKMEFQEKTNELEAKEKMSSAKLAEQNENIRALTIQYNSLLLDNEAKTKALDNTIEQLQVPTLEKKCDELLLSDNVTSQAHSEAVAQLEQCLEEKSEVIANITEKSTRHIADLEGQVKNLIRKYDELALENTKVQAYDKTAASVSILRLEKEQVEAKAAEESPQRVTELEAQVAFLDKKCHDLLMESNSTSSALDEAQLRTDEASRRIAELEEQLVTLERLLAEKSELEMKKAEESVQRIAAVESKDIDCHSDDELMESMAQKLIEATFKALENEKIATLKGDQIVKLQEEINGWNMSEQNLKSTVEELKKELNELKEEGSKDIQIATLQGENDKDSSESKTLLNQVDHLEKELDTTRRRLKAATDEKRQDLSNLKDTQIAKLQEEIYGWKVSEETLRSTVDELKKELNELKERSSRRIAESEEQCVILLRLLAEKNSLFVEANFKASENGWLITVKDNQIATLQGKNDKHSSETKTLHNQVDHLKKELDTTRRQLKAATSEKRQDLSSLKDNQIVKLQEEIKGFNVSEKNLKATVEEFKKELNELKEERSKDIQIATLQGENDKHSSEIKTLLNQVDHLEKVLDTTRELLKAAMDEKRQANCSIIELLKDVNDASAETKLLLEQFMFMKKSEAALSAALNQLKSELKTTQEMLETTKEEKAQQENNLEQLMKELNTEREHLETTTSEKREAHSRAVELSKYNDDFKSQIKLLVDQIYFMQKSEVVLTTELSQVQSELKATQGMLESATEKKIQKENEVDRLVEKNNKLSSDIEKILFQIKDCVLRDAARKSELEQLTTELNANRKLLEAANEDKAKTEELLVAMLNNSENETKLLIEQVSEGSSMSTKATNSSEYYDNLLYTPAFPLWWRLRFNHTDLQEMPIAIECSEN